jgi:hypothetical protein
MFESSFFIRHFRPDRDAGASPTGYPQEGGCKSCYPAARFILTKKNTTRCTKSVHSSYCSSAHISIRLSCS